MVRKYDHWYEYVGEYLKDAMKGWGIGAVFFLAIIGAAVYLIVTKGGAWVDNRMKVDGDTAQAALLNAQTNVTNADTSKEVAAAVTRLTSLQDKMSDQHDVMIAAVRQNGDLVTKIMADGTMPAREVREMMAAAAESMKPLPALRTEQNRIMLELLDTQKAVLKTLQGTRTDGQEKNELTPQTP